MKMRHQPFLLRDEAEENLVHFDGIDGGKPQPRKLGHMFQDARDQRSQTHIAGKVGAIGGEVDPGEHDLAEAPLPHAPAGFLDHCAPMPTLREFPSHRG